MSHQSVSVTAQHKQKQTNKNKQTTKQKQTIVDSPRIDPIDCDRFKQIIARILQTNINETCPSIPRYMQNNSSGGGGVGGGNINNEGDNDNYNKKTASTTARTSTSTPIFVPGSSSNTRISIGQTTAQTIPIGPTPTATRTSLSVFTCLPNPDGALLVSPRPL
jgi:hypothetical protein